MVKKVFVTSAFLWGVVYGQEPSLVPINVRPGSNCTVVVQWNMRPAADSFEYEVEKSRDMRTWETIGRVSNQVSHNYSCIDVNPPEGINYYRIREIAPSDQSILTETKWIQVDQAGKIYVWPSPARDMLHVWSPFANGTMNIVDEEGKFLFKITIIDYVTDIPMARLPKGIYFLYVIHRNEALVGKFLKQ